MEELRIKKSYLKILTLTILFIAIYSSGVISSPASICGDGDDVTGTNNVNCAARVVGTCEADNCCTWKTTPPPPTCVKNACNTLNNPDVCTGCDTCTQDWAIDNARGNIPWSITVQGKCNWQSGGDINIVSSRTLTCNNMWVQTGASPDVLDGAIYVN